MLLSPREKWRHSRPAVNSQVEMKVTSSRSASQRRVKKKLNLKLQDFEGRNYPVKTLLALPFLLLFEGGFSPGRNPSLEPGRTKTERFVLIADFL